MVCIFKVKHLTFALDLPTILGTSGEKEEKPRVVCTPSRPSLLHPPGTHPSTHTPHTATHSITCQSHALEMLFLSPHMSLPSTWKIPLKPDASPTPHLFPEDSESSFCILTAILNIHFIRLYLLNVGIMTVRCVSLQPGTQLRAQDTKSIW